MMRFPQTLRRKVAAFHEDESGNGAVELLLMVPVLSLITFGLITYFSAYQAKTHATRAATVIADMISRETNPITPNYMTGVSGLLDTMIRSDDDPQYRLTAFTWNRRSEDYRVRWSKNDGDQGTLTREKLNLVADRLPELKHGQRAILVETWVDFDAMSNVGMDGTTTFENFLVAAPRFVPQLCWSTDENADRTEARC